MFKTILYAAGMGLLGGQLAGCGGAEESAPTLHTETGQIIAGPMCDYIDDRLYYTAELGDGGDTIEGGRLGHWSAYFADGVARFEQSDVAASGSYTCKDGKVMLSLNGAAPIELDFDHGENPFNSHLYPFQSFRFNPFGAPAKHYIAADARKPDADAQCQQVAGRTYTALSTTARGAIAMETPFIAFGTAQAVEYEITGSGQAATRGIYECDLGEIHLHSAADDTAPVVVNLLGENGERITAEHGDYFIEMAAVDSRCTAEAREMCVFESQEVQCFDTPCPDGFHKTLLSCGDEPPLPYRLIHEGACGDLEGKPYYESTQCSAGEAVCGAVRKQEPCTSLPCPAVVHQTFADACAASDANAPVLFDGACGTSEGAPVAELPIPCTEQAGFPTCAKVHADIQCVTTPCPTHQYQTFASQCAAQTQLAAVTFSGVCAELEGVLAFDQPPVHIAEQLPQIDKQVQVTSAAIEGDVLTVELAYSGCSEQHFDFLASSAFKESAPVQVEYVFQPMVNDRCLAYFTTEFAYDLLPLKHVYQQAYQTDSGSIVLPEIGTYSF